MGAVVGRSDGAAVGSQLGAWLEARAGSRVGSRVGSQVGSWVGDEVGLRVGSWVGFPGRILGGVAGGIPRRRNPRRLSLGSRTGDMKFVFEGDNKRDFAILISNALSSFFSSPPAGYSTGGQASEGSHRILCTAAGS